MEYLTNAQGHRVPMDKVKAADQLRDELVKKLIADAKCEQAGLRRFKHEATIQVNDFVELVAADHGVTLGGKKGNISLLSYDGCQKVVVQVAQRITFDESLKAAKVILDELLHEWSENADPNLKVIVMAAFEVDKEGKISVSRLLGLRRLGIEHPKWKKGMDLISDSIVIVGSKNYIRFYERETAEDEWMAIPLDIAKLDIPKDK